MSLALLIVDHGSTRDEANVMLEEVAAIVRRKRGGLLVHIAHMEIARPTLEEGVEACVRDGATEVIVHPYMLSPGRHATHDIPAMVERAAARFPGVTFRVTGPLGIHDKIGEVVIERAGLA